MDVCAGWSGKRHGDIAFNESSCPLCAANEKIEQLTDKVIELEGTIEKLNQEAS